MIFLNLIILFDVALSTAFHLRNNEITPPVYNFYTLFSLMPGLLPRNDSLIQSGDDSFRNVLVDGVAYESTRPLLKFMLDSSSAN